MSDNDPNQELFRRLFQELRTLERRVEWIGMFAIAVVAVYVADVVYDHITKHFGDVWWRILASMGTGVLIIGFFGYLFEKGE